MAQHRPTPLLSEELETKLMFAIELDIVDLHEFGHSLGLAHYADTAANSIMEAFYNANYNKNNLASDVAVTVNGSDGYSNLMELFSDAAIAANSTSWKDSLDGNQNGVVNVSYSFVPDGTKLENNKRSNLFNAMASDIGPPATWQALFAEELARWGSVSTGNLSFSLHSDNGANSGTGLAQNDPNFGDIRIGGHRFDSPGGVLAHAYYPPPNGGSFAGDAHFASEEAWINGDPLTVDGGPVGRFARLVHRPDGDFFVCTFDEVHDHDHHAADLIAPSSDGLSVSDIAFAQAVVTGASTVSTPATSKSADFRVDQPIDIERSSFNARRAETTAVAEASVWSAYNLQNAEAGDKALEVLATVRAEVNSHAYKGIDNALVRVGVGGGKP